MFFHTPTLHQTALLVGDQIAIFQAAGPGTATSTCPPPHGVTWWGKSERTT